MEKEVRNGKEVERITLLQKERFGFVFEAFGRGPDAVTLEACFSCIISFCYYGLGCVIWLERQRPERLALPTLPGTGHFG